MGSTGLSGELGSAALKSAASVGREADGGTDSMEAAGDDGPRVCGRKVVSCYWKSTAGQRHAWGFQGALTTGRSNATEDGFSPDSPLLPSRPAALLSPTPFFVESFGMSVRSLLSSIDFSN